MHIDWKLQMKKRERERDIYNIHVAANQTEMVDRIIQLSNFRIFSAVDLVNEPYSTEKCRCKIKDVACLGWYVALFIWFIREIFIKLKYSNLKCSHLSNCMTFF